MSETGLDMEKVAAQQEGRGPDDDEWAGVAEAFAAHSVSGTTEQDVAGIEPDDNAIDYATDGVDETNIE